MSIRINGIKCIGCGKCSDICPGNLIEKDNNDKALMKFPKDCWGCTACLKECQTGAITYFLGADIGGKGGYLYTRNQKEYIDWYIVGSDGQEQHIQTVKHESNKY